jgi:NitT/TauT family transport system substrate-binding protein
MSKISIQFSRFSAFYSPLIVTMAGGFLKDEGLDHEWSNSPVGRSAVDALVDGSAHVVQSAPSQGFLAAAKGKTPPEMHFAQVNEMDGFFLAAQKPDPDFSWDKLNGARIIVDQTSVQPLCMFKYACFKMGLDFDKLQIVNAGTGADMINAFKEQKGDYIHLQGPAPQQLEYDGAGHIVAAVGPAIGPCAFSSLAATREWLTTDMAKAFTRAYGKARGWLLTTPADEVAGVLSSYFPAIHRSTLGSTVAYYQKLGNWTPHVDITRPAYEAALDVFQHSGLISKRPAYEDVIAAPPV